MQDGSSQSAAGIYEDLYMLPENPQNLKILIWVAAEKLIVRQSL